MHRWPSRERRACSPPYAKLRLDDSVADLGLKRARSRFSFEASEAFAKYIAKEIAFARYFCDTRLADFQHVVVLSRNLQVSRRAVVGQVPRSPSWRRW